MLEVLDQVYETVRRDEVLHALAPQAPCFVEVNIQILKDDGFHEALQGLLKVSQVFQCLGCQVRSDNQGPSESGDYLAAYHVRPVVARGLNPPHNGPLPRHHPNAALSSPELPWRCTDAPLNNSHRIQDDYVSIPPTVFPSLSATSRLKTRVPLPVWTALSQSPGHLGCLVSRWRA